ncbi:MAG: K+/H+ antiporter subunit F [Burkholderiales bacterium]
MLDLALNVAFAAFGLAFLLAAFRLLRGPSAPDRILALDTLYVDAVALALLLAVQQDSAAYFEVALLIALIGFVSTVALARFVARGDVTG